MACWHVGPLDPRVDLDRGVARVPPGLERHAFSVQGVRLEDENSLSSSLAWPGLGGPAGVSLLPPSPPGPSLHTPMHGWWWCVCVQCTSTRHATLGAADVTSSILGVLGSLARPSCCVISQRDSHASKAGELPAMRRVRVTSQWPGLHVFCLRDPHALLPCPPDVSSPPLP